MNKESTDQTGDTKRKCGCFPLLPRIILDPDDPQHQQLRELVERYRGKEGASIPILQGVQEIFGYVPEMPVSYISQELGIPSATIYGVVTFYAQFHTEPRGRYVIRACRGTACHVKGGKAVLKAIQDKLGLCDGETSPDLKFTLETVACLGACALAPVVMINHNYYGKQNPQKILRILEQYEDEG
ncbi:MAG: NADH-quinone oxidoreductase subunit NuoE [bacterium]